MRIIMDNEEYIDVAEVAEMMGCSVSTVRIKTRAKEMPLPIDIPSRTFWKKSVIDTFLKQDYKKRKPEQ